MIPTKVPDEVYLSHEQYGEMVKDRSILEMFRGSVTHGTYMDTGLDDIDTMNVVVPTIDFFFGLNTFGSRGTVEIKYNEWDIVAYDIQKFIGLLSYCNPNVIGMLWLRPEHYIKVTDGGRLLLDSRDIFTSKKLFKPFLGYAKSQRDRMDKMKTGLGYAGEKRKKLINKFGFDCKNASHLIRLLRTAVEFSNTGEMQVYREKDADELISIKRGEWSYEKVIEEYKKLESKLEKSMAISKLPNNPDMDKVNQLCVKIVEMELL